MNKLKSLLRVFSGKAVLCAVLALLFFAASAPLFAQTAEVRYAAVYYKDGAVGNSATGLKNVYCDWSNPNGTFAFGTPSSTDTVNNKSFVYSTSTVPSGNGNKNDPWVSSALIEYDQPYPSAVAANAYPNHCLSLCMNVVCTNKPMSQSTYSISFPLQQVKFDIVKYYNNKNVENPEETPAIRTIDLYPDTSSNSAVCGSYHCIGAGNGDPCPGAEYVCQSGANSGSTNKYCVKWAALSKLTVDFNKATQTQLNTAASSASAGSAITAQACYQASSGSGDAGKYNCAVSNGDGQESGLSIPFCAAWDGSYEIAGEFGKSNGQFAFRATVATDSPGDNIITDKIEFNSTIAYPGMNQIPMQVDVTNIHTVRSTPSVVGNITAVSAQPYTYAYRLSKDADVRIAIFDASNGDDLSYGSTNMGDPIKGKDQIVRTLVDWQPRLGEGLKGVEKDVQITEFDSWDGRNDNGLLLPAGNYVVSLQAKAQDEWPGVDFSRAVTRQLS